MGKKIQDTLKRVKALDGKVKVVREEMQPAKLRLAKDDKGAMVNDLVDKYLRKELTNEYLEQMKAEFKITIKDMTREIAKREIHKALGI